MLRWPKPSLTSLAAWLFLLSGLLFSFFTLDSFPFIHSDEVWLADLSRQILEAKNPAAGESFFRLTPRYPHALKTLYHLIQGPFVHKSFSPWSARLPSFWAGLFSLAAAGWAARRSEILKGWWFMVPLALLWNLQFLYASHFGRQEIFLLAIFMAGYGVLNASFRAGKKGTVLGLVTAPGIFIHPNSFIIALSLGVMLIYRDVSGSDRRNVPLRQKARGWFLYAGILAVTAAAAVILSFYWDPEFLAHYKEFGDTHGVGLPLFLKLRRLPRFFYKMYIQAAGTYYLPPLKGVFFAGGVALLLRPLLGLLTKTPRALETTISFLGLAAGLMLIGKYSPPSLLFFLPPAFFALTESLILTGRLIGRSRLPRIGAAAPLVLGAVLFLLQAGSTVQEVRQEGESGGEYHRYQLFLTENIPPGEPVLANLNTGFILDTRTVHPYRDLAFLEERGISVTEYLLKEGINYVVWPEEMEIIFAQRPVWNDLYGNLYPYYEELYDLFRRSTPTARGYFPVYGMRIIPYQGRRGGAVTLFRLSFP